MATARTEVTVPPPVVTMDQVTMATAKTEVTLPPPVANMDEVKMATAKAVADLTAKAHLERAANPAPVTRRPIVPAPAPAPAQSRSRTPMLMIAAAVIVGAIGAAEGARRLGFEWPRQDAREAQPVQATPIAAPSTTEVVNETNAIAANRTSAMTPPRAAAEPKAGTPVARRAPVRQANSPAPQVVPVGARTPAPETPAPAPTTPSAPVAAESARPSAPLTGRFFESRDVDEPPRIATRVEPRLPGNLPAGAENKKVVVARVLVSRTGRPYHVSLLRGSMLGRASDEAVVAAVMQWTFSPATKRGEPVNCWYNIGVPLGQAH
jgi:hypothetical protein